MRVYHSNECFNVFIQENENTITVFGRSHRTTSALEGFNSQLNKKIPKHGNFFKFTSLLCDIEFVKSRELTQSVDGGGTATIRKKDNLIRAAESELVSNKITVMEFLNRVTKKSNNIVTNMAHFQVLVGYLSDSDEDISNEDFDKGPIVAECLPVASPDECIICTDNKPNVMFLPCRHFKCCDVCASALAARSVEKFACPCCKRTVEDTIIAFI